MSRVACVVLAAGMGTRMKSDRPKVLHQVLGRPMILRVLDSLVEVPGMKIIVVVGHEAELVKATVTASYPGKRVGFVQQVRQLGTGHALATALGSIPGNCPAVMVVNGDLPLLRRATLMRLSRSHARRRAAVTVATMELADPTGYGRILRNGKGAIQGVREQKDCTFDERRIHEVNAGLYCFSRRFLEANISRLRAGNAQKELYLTDMVAMAAHGSSGGVSAIEVKAHELTGVNDRAELAHIEQALRDELATRLMASGVTMMMPHTIWVEQSVEVGKDTVVEPGCILTGKTRIGRRVRVGAGSIISGSEIQDGAVIKPYCVIENATVRRTAIVGPFARLRPGSDVGRMAHIGNFVELKKTVIGTGSKANHLSYLGDGVIGDNVNIGAGTIFCNYDGYGKHTTVIGDDVFIGSDSQMVAPVEIGSGSYVGSGSTITRNVPPGSLAMGRARQVNKDGRAAILREILRARRNGGDGT